MPGTAQPDRATADRGKLGGDTKRAADAAVAKQKADDDASAEAQAGAERRRAEEDRQQRAAAEAKRIADEQAARRDPALSVSPGSGKLFRDGLANAQPCPMCPEMVVVPSGSFTMGAPVSEPSGTCASPTGGSPCSDNEGQVTVSIARPFAVGKFAVTRGEFAFFAAETGHKVDGGCRAWTGIGSGYKLQADLSWHFVGFTQDERHPVVCINWNDAKAYAAWLSSKTGKSYRLLSEAEQEYVTRAATTTPFWWGSSISTSQANYNGNYTFAGGSKGEYRSKTVPVDSFAPNPWGLYQVHGNVSEWTEDCWNDSNMGNPGNGTARTSGDCSRRVVRGGSWTSSPQSLRAAHRYWFTTDDRNNANGFRLARTLNP
jgi:formylglycine-generating enzyme required for sulfatase activity